VTALVGIKAWTRLPLAHDHPAWQDFGALEWILAGSAGLFTAWAIWRAVVYTLRPGEEEPDHLKRMIFEDPADAPASQAMMSGNPHERGEGASHA
jgi:hypothetical protein